MIRQADHAGRTVMHAAGAQTGISADADRKVER